MPKVDCVWDGFGDWSACSETCGGGERSRKRTKQIEESNGGKECTGRATEMEPCNDEPCTSKILRLGVFLLDANIFCM